MSLAVIGAGFGRTGTESMKLALEQLGLGPCHHMLEVMKHPEQKALWRAVAKGAPPDWNRALDGYRSAVDWPTAFYWRELSSHFPDAKVLLTTRSAESWLRSFSSTILKVLEASTDADSLGIRLIRDRVFDGRIDDPDHLVAVFERNVADVQATIPSDRLLTYTVGDGWEPLCEFLDLPIPDTPFPHSNSTAMFTERMNAPSDGGTE